MNNLKSLKDIFCVHTQKDLQDLSPEKKISFCDNAMTGPDKGIIVTFGLSASARRINNRIYTPKGQRAGLDSWVKPYAKPILLHHDRLVDPIGRIIQVDYIENDQEAMRFFRSIQDFMNFKDAVATDKPEVIYKALVKNNLLTNTDWPGLGRLKARARITDRTAIEKFLDERYLTFSAGTHSDRYVCGPCGADWATGDMCDHMPGSLTDKGEPVVFITGLFAGDEASVVNQPAYVSGVVQSIEFSDSADLGHFDLKSLRIDETAIYHVDSVIEVQKMDIDFKDHRLELFQALESEDFQRLKDGIDGKTFSEQKILVSIHDGLHHHYDWDIKYSDGKELRIPKDAFSLHAQLHELSVSGAFRDAFINGELDQYSATGESTGEFKYPTSKDADETVKPLNDSSIELVAGSGFSIVDALADLKAQILEGITELTVIAKSKDTISACLLCESAQKDYGAALLRIGTLEETIENLKISPNALDTDNKTRQNVTDEFSSVTPLLVVENPSVSGHGTGTKAVKGNLGDYEKTIVNRYLDIQSKQGKEAADLYLGRKKAARHIPANFNIINFIQESD